MPRKQKKYHYIYKTTCKITGKFYVGMHSTDDLDDGYLGSGKILGYSRKKYGDENHVREILEMLPSREALKAREKEIVNEQLLSDPLNINLKYGGDGGWDHVDKTTILKNTSKATAGFSKKFQSDADFRSKFRQTLTDRVHKRRDSGEIFFPGASKFLGKTHSTESRKRISAAAKINQCGEKNSQFGTCWVTNGKPIKIKKEQLDEYLLKGYRRGRK